MTRNAFLLRIALVLSALSMVCCATLFGPAVAAERDLVQTAVPRVQPARVDVSDGTAHGSMPLSVSHDWTRSDPTVLHAVIVIPGWPRRDLTSAEKAAGGAARDTLIITPQFLTATDVDAHKLSSDTLRWGADSWPLGWPAKAPQPVSSYAVVDSILKRLADRTLFPNLREIILAGHSAGGQFVQRYAALGKGATLLATTGIHLRYVIANPASYLYFDTSRPTPESAARELAQGPDNCAAFNNWPYGLDGNLPPYVAQPISAAAIEQHYAAQDIIYLLGTLDNDPGADGLARSCAAEREGPSRYVRGQSFLAILLQRHPETTQHIVSVPGVGHHSPAMYASPCGRAAVFGTPTCAVTTP